MIPNSNKLVEAYIKDTSGKKHIISFKVDTVAYLISLEEECAAIILQSGISIAVDLEYGELKKLIYNSDFKQGNLIDLKEITEKDVITPNLPNSIKKLFNEKAELKIKAILREEYEVNVKEFTFTDKDIKSMAVSNNSKGRGGKSIELIFNKNAVKPFESDRAMLDMPFSDFMELKVKAEENHDDMLNLVKTFANNKNKYGLR